MVFTHLKQAAAWQVVFDKATHGAFGQRARRIGPPPDPRYHRAILALTTAFWDAELKGDGAARMWLNEDGVKNGLAPVDRWEKNGKTSPTPPSAEPAKRRQNLAAVGN